MPGIGSCHGWLVVIILTFASQSAFGAVGATLTQATVSTFGQSVYSVPTDVATGYVRTLLARLPATGCQIATGLRCRPVKRIGS